MFKMLIYGASIAMLFLFSIACAPREAKAPETALTPEKKTAIEPVSKSTWQEEWQRTVTAAKREGKVVVYLTGSAEVRTAVVKAFGDTFGIAVEAITGTGRELATRITRERKAGLFLADIYQGGVTTPIVMLKPEGVLAPLEPAFMLPELKDPGNKKGLVAG